MGDELRLEIATRLRTAREWCGLSQAQAASLLRMHRPTLSTIEAGKRKVSAEEISDFARVYQVSPGWLIGENSDEKSPELELAARELAKLGSDDVNILLNVITSLKSKKNR